MNSPSNPTGELDDLEAAAAFGRTACNVPVLSDECYAEFTWEGEPRTILSNGTQGVLAVHSISKRSNAAGLRVGFYAGDESLVHYLVELRRHSGFMVPGPIQAAGIVALDDDAHAGIQRDALRRAHGALHRDPCGHRRRGDAAAGSFYLWVKVPERYLDDGTGEESPEWPFVRFLAEAAGMLVSPGEFYGRDGEGYVRIALVEPIERIELVASRLQAAPVAALRAIARRRDRCR